MKAFISEARKKYHLKLLENGVLTIDAKGIPSNADSASGTSIAIAQGIFSRLMPNRMVTKTHKKSDGQTAGAKFEQINMEFLLETFPKLQNLRPGDWQIKKFGNKNAIKTSNFSQYEHLEYLNRLTAADAKLAASMGNDYIVTPDVVIYRNPVSDEEINTPVFMVDDSVSLMAAIRKSKGGLPILHASISAKWTMRSDRAQNSRTEALGLIRNRKGHLPHIVVVTGEPMPGRLASLALGTGDIDCMYHFALYELVEAVKETKAEDSIEMLNVLIKGKRIKDISDLPLDLSV
ncbi:MAG: type II restriction endonuclease [Lentisphaerae bacterium]|nr:type II restriction endonuclease [Lentisphaerota bacterium]OQC17469.1 MAG: Type-2 restriction enzyme NgoMIV [Lentisphaerae bacterium ADurb.Bin082]HQL87989.1 NgoMIV family type II restriction endonuclease [Lentisphaeria bacterium]